LEKVMVSNQLVQIGMVELGDQPVEKLASTLAATLDQLGVIGGDQYQWNQPDMLTGFDQGFTILEDELLFSCLEGAANFQGILSHLKASFNREEILTVRNIE